MIMATYIPTYLLGAKHSYPSFAGIRIYGRRGNGRCGLNN